MSPGGPAVLSCMQNTAKFVGVQAKPRGPETRDLCGDASAPDLWAQRFQVSQSVGNGVGSSALRLPQAQNNILKGLRPDGVRRKHDYVLLLP